MDSLETIQVFLAIMMVMMVAGFTIVLYFLLRISRILAGQEPEGITRAQSEPADDPQSATIKPKEPAGDVDPGSAKSLEGYLGAISRKYSLASFTLATADGLLIGSTKPGSEEEAARYSHLYARGGLHDETGAELLGIPYRGETIVGIVHPSKHLSTELMNALKQDTRDALQRWV